jgi:hypothetical protein
VRGCAKARTRILRGLDQALEISERFELEQHLERCLACRDLHEKSLGIEEVLGRLAEPPAQPDLARAPDLDRAVERVRAAIDEGRGGPVFPLGGHARVAWRRRALAIAAGIGILLSIVSWLVARADGESDVGDIASSPARERASTPPSDSGAAAASPAVIGDEAEGDDDLVLAEAGNTAPAADFDEFPAHQGGERRLEEVRSQLRSTLLASFEGVDPTGDARAAIERCDSLTVELAREGRWPLVRIAEGLLVDPIPTLAAGAARYVGAHGDRVSVARLVAALERAEIAPSVVAALSDLGDAGLPALLAASRRPGLSEMALACISGRADVEAAAALADEIRARPEDDERAAHLLAALGHVGPAAVPAFLRLAGERPRDAEHLLAPLAAIPGADVALVGMLAPESSHDTDEILLIALRILQPDTALPWIEQRVRASLVADRALDALAAWRSDRGLEVLFVLAADVRADRERVLEVSRDAMSANPARAERLALRVSEEGDVVGAQRLLDIMVDDEAEGVGPALCALALASGLPVDLRTWAALAVGELGTSIDAERLAAGLHGRLPFDKKLLAAALISIHALLGEAGVRPFLDAAPERVEKRVLFALQGALDRPGAVALQRVARELDQVLNASYPRKPETLP